MILYDIHNHPLPVFVCFANGLRPEKDPFRTCFFDKLNFTVGNGLCAVPCRMSGIGKIFRRDTPPGCPPKMPCIFGFPVGKYPRIAYQQCDFVPKSPERHAGRSLRDIFQTAIYRFVMMTLLYGISEIKSSCLGSKCVI